jgi:hypothetical protein
LGAAAGVELSATTSLIASLTISVIPLPSAGFFGLAIVFSFNLKRL